MIRYFGVFANRHHLRSCIIPPSAVPAPGQQLPLGLADPRRSHGRGGQISSARRHRATRSRTRRPKARRGVAPSSPTWTPRGTNPAALLADLTALSLGQSGRAPFPSGPAGLGQGCPTL